VRAKRGECVRNPEPRAAVEALRDKPTSERRRLIRNLSVGLAWVEAGDAFQVTADDLATAKGRPSERAQAFLDTFAVSFGELGSTVAFRGFHPLRGRPIIRDEGQYYCTYHGNVLYALRQRLEEGLKPETGSAATEQRWERYNQTRRRYIEHRAVRMLGASLKTDLAWTNPTYSVDGGDAIEIDGLVILDRVALVLEAKGAPLTGPARRALEPRLKRDVETVLSAAADQAGRLSSAIEEGRTIEFRDSNGEPIPLDPQQLSRVFPIVVTLDDFSGLSTSAWALAEADLLDVPEPLLGSSAFTNSRLWWTSSNTPPSFPTSSCDGGD
jgi:hypothetical protein